MEADRARWLIGSAYAVAGLMVMIALADVFGRVLPLRPADTTWRLGSLGILTLGVPNLLLALLIACVTAWYLQHRRTLRSLSILAFLTTGILVLSLPFFALDALELRRLVAPAARESFYVAMGRAGLTLLVSAAVTGWIATASWKLSRVSRSGVRARSANRSALVGEPNAAAAPGS